MAERLKDLFFTDEFIAELGKAIYTIYPDFDQEEFTRLIFSEGWESMESWSATCAWEP